MKLASVVVVLASLLAACSAADDAAASTTAPTLPQPVTSTSSPFRSAADLVASFGDPRLEGVPIVSSRERLDDTLEAGFIGAARSSALGAKVGVGLESLDDATILYLGYFYCIGMDNGLSAEVAMAEVAASLVGLDGRSEATGDDNWRAAIIALTAASWPCPIHFDPTATFIESAGQG